MRISALQKKVLLVLSALEERGHKEPLPVVTLLDMINTAVNKDIYATNLRTSLHTLRKNGLVIPFRNQTLNLAFSLSEEGRKKAERLRLDIIL